MLNFTDKEKKIERLIEVLHTLPIETQRLFLAVWLATYTEGDLQNENQP